MNILQIVSSSRVSGAEKHVVVLADRLRRRGHDVTAVCPPGGWIGDQLRAANVPTIEIDLHGPQACVTTLRLARLANRRRIDVIHSHLTCAAYHSCLIGKMTSRPVVSSLHVQSRDLVYRRLVPRGVNRIIAVSNFLRDSLLRYGVPGASVRTIYNGTDFFHEELREREPHAVIGAVGEDSDGAAYAGRTAGGGTASELSVHAELSLPPGAQMVGLVGNVHSQKGHPILVKAARSIVAACPRAYFIFVGHARPQMQQMLWELAAENGVAERLRFMGIRNDVSRLMDAMHVITAPSENEACPMVVIEAMAVGKPVVAARVGGIPELVREQETGLLVERTPGALADAVVSLLRDPARRAAMGRAGRDRALTHFSADTMVSNIESLYRDVLAARAAA